MDADLETDELDEKVKLRLVLTSSVSEPDTD
jgi:hypothetical protein